MYVCKVSQGKNYSSSCPYMKQMYGKECKKLCNYRKNSFDVSKVRQRFIKGICSPTRYIFAAYCGFINIR